MQNIDKLGSDCAKTSKNGAGKHLLQLFHHFRILETKNSNFSQSIALLGDKLTDEVRIDRLQPFGGSVALDTEVLRSNLLTDRSSWELF